MTNHGPSELVEVLRGLTAALLCRPAAMLTRDQAAAYLGVSVTVFDAEVANGIWPQPIRRGAKGTKPTWSVRAIDERIAELDRKATVAVKPPDVAAPPMTAQMDAALRRMRARRG